MVAVISVKALDAVDVEVRAAAPAHAPVPAGQPLEEGIPHSLNTVQIGGQVLRGEGKCVENAVIAEQGQAQLQLVNAGAAHSWSGPLADEALAVLAAADEAGSVRREGLHKRPRPLADAYKWVSHPSSPPMRSPLPRGSGIRSCRSRCRVYKHHLPDRQGRTHPVKSPQSLLH